MIYFPKKKKLTFKHYCFIYLRKTLKKNFSFSKKEKKIACKKFTKCAPKSILTCIHYVPEYPYVKNLPSLLKTDKIMPCKYPIHISHASAPNGSANSKSYGHNQGHPTFNRTSNNVVTRLGQPH